MSDPVVEIRACRPGDEAAIEAMAGEVVDAGDAFVFEDVQGVRDYWLGPGAKTFVALLDGEVAGTYALKANNPGRGAHVANAGYMVSRSFRGRGIAHVLGQHSLETARELGFAAMQFNMVVATNTRAVEAWKRLGFRIVGTLPGVFRHDVQGRVDAYVMFREL